MIFPIIALAAAVGTLVFAILMIVMILRDKPFLVPGLLMLVCAVVFAGSVFMVTREDSDPADKSTGDQSVVDQSEPDTSGDTSQPDDNNSDLSAIGDISVDSGLFNVTLTIPSDYIDEGITQDQLNQAAKENGYKSATLNNDGSVTYVMTKAQHRKMMDGIEQSIDDSLKELTESGDNPNIAKIEANGDYTEFKVVLKSESVTLADSFTTLGFYFSSGMYHVFNGTTVDNVNVQFVSEATGQVIEEANSKDMG